MFLRSIFPRSLPGLEPEILFFDNACGLRSHIKGCPDNSILDRMAIVVDAFHYGGHKESDELCKEFCSPNKYPVLKRADGSWLFNSSAAEQNNVWVVGYGPMCREMRAIKYNFFLDEMIIRKNRAMIEKLERTGHMPGSWPTEDL